MDSKLKGPFLQEDTREAEPVSVENFIQFESQVCIILHEFQEFLCMKMLEVKKNCCCGRVINNGGAKKMVALLCRLRKANHIRKLLSEVNEKLAGADNIDSELIPKIKEIERLVEELSEGNLSEVDTERRKIGGYVRKVGGKDIV